MNVQIECLITLSTIELLVHNTGNKLFSMCIFRVNYSFTYLLNKRINILMNGIKETKLEAVSLLNTKNRMQRCKRNSGSWI